MFTQGMQINTSKTLFISLINTNSSIIMEEQSKKPTYKYCIVPKCKNTIRNAPNKVFFHVPRGADIRKKWCKIMKRDMVSPSTCLYCCEDHFDIEEDTDNYMEYKIMYLQEKRNCTLRLKKGVVPHKFECRKETILQPASGRKGSLKRKPLETIEDVSTAPPVKQTVVPVQAEIKVCRGCLALDVKMFDMKDFELTEMFQNVTGISVSDNTGITHHRVCWECAARLTAAATFRDKALLSDALLKDIAHMKKSDIATLKQNYGVLKSRLTVYTALSTSNIKCEQAYKETSNNENLKEIKTEIMNQADIEFEEHDPWFNVPVKTESNPTQNNIKVDAFKNLTHLNDDFTFNNDTGHDKNPAFHRSPTKDEGSRQHPNTNIGTLEKNHSILASRLTDSKAFNFLVRETRFESKYEETATIGKKVFKQERKETNCAGHIPWQNISVKIELESDPTAENNTKSDAIIKEIYMNNDSMGKEGSGCDIPTSDLRNNVEKDTKISGNPVISKDRL
ncbi:hypothetical protein PYW08_012264 [Mythimna loreyi]|uniref:Uncharacterized protein n=1 Tax=Mythimna loreyi TaxID=667449 RepID=A0ACC2Q4R2_9NEOP|nr:hypothetical protein PYW08_012264 [Mythimna loreyi]